MSAEKGNKYASKWDEGKAKAFADSVLEIVTKDKKVRSLERACVEAGKYETVLHYLLEAYPDQVFEAHARAKAIIKYRLIDLGLDNVTNPRITELILKNNHGMADKVHTDNKHEVTGDFITLPDGSEQPI